MAARMELAELEGTLDGGDLLVHHRRRWAGERGRGRVDNWQLPKLTRK